MNFLQLAQRLRQEAGISGTGPTTTIAQTGEMKRVCDWINAAWIDIQTTNRDWDWMRVSTTFPTVAGKTTYAPVADLALSDFGMWSRDSFRVYDTAAGMTSETYIAFQPYEVWRDTYLYGANRTTTSRPSIVTITPAKELAFGPITAAGYTIVGDYFKSPSELAADADLPAMPTHYHMAIIYRALMFYGAYENATEVYQHGQVEFTKLMYRMNLDRLPEIQFAGPLA